MALTRPKLGQINTNVTVLNDAITVLSAGANQANVDVGFLINRAHGLVPNAAFYYSETLDTFVTAFTANSGGTDSNILVTNYADFTAGNVYTTGLYWTGNGLPINFATGGSGSGNITVRSLFSGNLQPNVTVANITAIEFDEESGFDIQNRGSGNVLVAMNSTFKYWEVTGSEQLVAVGLDHITINSGNNLVITSNANATPYKSITFSVNSNPVFNNVSAAGYFWANGTPFVSSNYGNTDVSAYLDSYFIYANANAASQTTAFTTLDANVGSYQLWANTSITNLQSNAAFQANLIDVLTGNAASQGSLLDVLVANAVEQSANLTSLLSNAAAQEASLTSLVNNAASQSGAIDSINANVGSYQLYANANAATQATAISTIDANLGAYQVWANSTFGTSSYGDSNVASYLSPYYTYANANAATQTTEIVGLRANIEAANAAIITANTGMKSYVDDQIVSAGGYGNTQVNVYLPTYTGNLNPGNITASGTIVGGGVRNTSGSTPPANPTVGDTWYDTDNDTLLRYINDGDSNQWVDLSGIIVGETPTAFGNAEVAAYLTTYTGNISAGNIISGNIVPSANVTYNLGTSELRWKDIYLSGNTIYLGDTTITENKAIGTITFIPPATIDNPNPTAIVFSANGSISTVETVNGTATANTVISTFSNITVTGNVVSDSVYATSYFFANGTPFVSGGGTTYTDSNVAAYLPTHTGNISAGNVTVTGNIVGGGVRNSAGSTPPADPSIGDKWWNTNNDILYTYLSDGTSKNWIDTGGPVAGTGIGITNLDAGTPYSVYGGLTGLDCGGVT